MSRANSTVNASNGGMGCVSFFAVLLQVLFIGLKLTQQIDWSWWLVFLPLICYVFFVATILVVTLLIVIVVAEYMKRQN